jgi:hypothetical protein
LKSFKSNFLPKGIAGFGLPLNLEKQSNGSSALIVPAGTYIIADLHLPAMEGQKINMYTITMDVKVDSFIKEEDGEKGDESKGNEDDLNSKTNTNPGCVESQTFVHIHLV